MKYMVCQRNCHRFGVAPSNFQTRLRAMGRQARRVRWPSLTFKMSIFFHTSKWPWPSDQVNGSALAFHLFSCQLWPWVVHIWNILGVCPVQISPRPQISSKPWEWMEISIHPHCKSGWWGNTIPMDWNTFWVHMNWISGYFQKGAN